MARLRVRRALMDRGWRLQDLAAACGCSFGHVAKPSAPVSRARIVPTKKALLAGRRNATLFAEYCELLKKGLNHEAAAVRAGISTIQAWRWRRRVSERGGDPAEALTPRFHASGSTSPVAHLLTDELLGELETLVLRHGTPRKATRHYLQENPDCPEELRAAFSKDHLPTPLRRALAVRRFKCQAFEAPSGLIAVHLPDGRVIYVEPPQDPQ
jgi:hypothetical protein